MDITTEEGALFNNHPRLKNKALLFDITIVNPSPGPNLGNAARHAGKHLADAVEWKKYEYRGSFLATYSLLPLAMSTCREIDSDVRALIKELAIRRVEHSSETHFNESQHLAEGTEVASLRLRFSFCYTADHRVETGTGGGTETRAVSRMRMETRIGTETGKRAESGRAEERGRSAKTAQDL